LLVRHGPGFVLAWVDRRGEEAFDLWGGAALPEGTEVTLPAAVVPLAGTMQALRVRGSRSSWMLHLRAATPVLRLVKQGDAPPEVGPVAVRPALAGIELPGTGPPDEVVREYMSMAGAVPP